MKRVGTAIVIASALIGCGDDDLGPETVRRFDGMVVEAAAKHPTRVVKLAAATDFEWDRVHAGEYSEEGPGFRLEFSEDGDPVVTARRFLEADFGCFERAEGYGPEAMQFLVWEYRYNDGSLYRLLLPAAISTDLNHPELIKCVRRRVPELLDNYRRGIS